MRADATKLKEAVHKFHEEADRIRRELNSEICDYCGEDIFGKPGDTCPQCGAPRTNKKTKKWPKFPLGRPEPI